MILVRELCLLAHSVSPTHTPDQPDPSGTGQPLNTTATGGSYFARTGARASWSHLCLAAQWSRLVLPQQGVTWRGNNRRWDLSCTWSSWFPALFGLKHDMCRLEEFWKQSGSVGIPICILIHPKCHYFSSFHSCVMTVLELNSNNQPKGLFACVCAWRFCKRNWKAF